jgi:heme A synthase
VRGTATGTTRWTLSTAALAWTALIGNGLVIIQGAIVRATGSGAGCGRHWPTCNGAIVPLDAGLETTIEFSHRMLSLAVLLLGVWLLRRALRLRRENPGLFAFAATAFVFLVIEALLGGATVLFGLTGDNVSVGRGIMVASHLVNSLLLIGTLTGTVLYARDARPAWPLGLRRQGALSAVLIAGLAGMLVLMFSGGIAAMGNTMFPSASLAEGFAADFDPTSHPLIRVRILHPLIAITVGVYLLVSLGLGWWMKRVPQARRPAQALLTVYLVQMLVGTINLAFLAPVALQVLHLSLAVLAFALLTAVSTALLGHPADDPIPSQSRTVESA